MISSLIRRAAAPLFLVAVLVLVAAPARAELGDADAERAKGFITELGGDAISSLTGDGLTDEDRRERFAVLLRDNFNVDLISRFVLGRFWRTASEEERTDFRDLFENFIVAAYANRFKDYGGEEFLVTAASVKKRDIWVESEIRRAQPGAPAIRIRWRVRPVKATPDELRIIDVVVEGLSMSITQRDEFASVIQQGGGKVAALNDALRARLGN